MRGPMTPIEHRPYGLFTPVHNEEGNVKSLVKSVISQRIRPLVWLVVDDFSTDSTWTQLEDMSKTVPSLSVVKPPMKRGNFNLHLAEVYDYGIREVGNRLNRLGITRPYIGSLDADVVLDPTCIGRLKAILDNNERAGVVAPSVGHIRQRGKSREQRGPFPFWIPGELSNAVRLYKSECLEAAGWIPHVPAHDARVLQRIRESGWQAARIPETLAWLTRRTG